MGLIPVVFTMKADFSVFVQLALSVPFCLQFWFSYDKLQRKEILQAGSKVKFAVNKICIKEIFSPDKNHYASCEIGNTAGI